MIPPTSIDGTDITGATIDGTDVQEITVDGDVVFSAGPTVTVLDDFEDNNTNGWNPLVGATKSITNFAAEGSFAMETTGTTSNNSANFKFYSFPTNKEFELRFEGAWSSLPGFFAFQLRERDSSLNFVGTATTMGYVSGDLVIDTGAGRTTLGSVTSNNQYIEGRIRVDPVNQTVVSCEFGPYSATLNESYEDNVTINAFSLDLDNANFNLFLDDVRLVTDF